MKPTVGRIVHYYDPIIPGLAPAGALAALIVKVREGGSVRLRVFGPDEYLSCDVVVDADFAETPTPGCWSWPPRVP